MHGYDFMNGWGHMSPVMWLFMLIFLGLIAFGLIALVRWGFNRGNPPLSERPDSPLDILKKRYARGEIDGEEFERIKKDLE